MTGGAETNKLEQGCALGREHMVERIAQHKHCKNCDKAIPYKDEYCDESCESLYKGKLQGKKRQLVYFYIAMVVVFMLSIGLVFLA